MTSGHNLVAQASGSVSVSSGKLSKLEERVQEPCAIATRTGTYDIRYIKIFVYLADVMLKMGTYFGEFIPVDTNHAEFIHLRILSGQRCVHPMTVPFPACGGRIKSMPPPRLCETSCGQELEWPNIRRSIHARWFMISKDMEC
jgi:hypothetical protein